MRRNLIIVGTVAALGAAFAGWFVLGGLGRDSLFIRPGDVPACGLAWRVVAGAQPSKEYDELHGVAALSPNDAWAVGTLGTEQFALTFIEHWDGQMWQHVESPSVPQYSNHLYAVAAVSGKEVWAVGASHNGTDVWHTMAMWWDGAAWRIVPTPNVGPISSLNGVSAVSASDIWAVGESSTGSKGQGTQALVLHWDGAIWSMVATGVRRQNGTLNAVAAISSHNIWAGGSYSDKSGTVLRPLLLHWDGKSWGEVEAQGDGVIWAMSAVSAEDIWAVGSFGPQTVTMHWDGRAWARVPSPNRGAGNNSLNGVAAISASNVWAVGSSNRQGADQAMAIHWDGVEWKAFPAPSIGKYSDILSSVAAVRVSGSAESGGDVWAVGSYIADAVGTNLPVMQRYSDPCH